MYLLTFFKKPKIFLRLIKKHTWFFKHPVPAVVPILWWPNIIWGLRRPQLPKVTRHQKKELEKQT